MVNIYKGVYNNIIKYNLQVSYDDVYKDDINIYIPEYNWKKSVIINELIRCKYSQDHVEAIINNHFLNIAEWLDAKFKGEEVKFSDPEYDEFQAWRKECKVIADEALTKTSNK